MIQYTVDFKLFLLMLLLAIINYKCVLSAKTENPLPTKASLARGPSSKRKVPPIPVDRTPTQDDIDSIYSARDSIFDDDDDDDDSLVGISCQDVIKI